MSADTTDKIASLPSLPYHIIEYIIDLANLPIEIRLEIVPSLKLTPKKLSITYFLPSMTNTLIKNFKNRIFVTQVRSDILTRQRVCLYDVLIPSTHKFAIIYRIYEKDDKILFAIEYQVNRKLAASIYDLHTGLMQGYRSQKGTIKRIDY